MKTALSRLLVPAFALALPTLIPAQIEPGWGVLGSVRRPWSTNTQTGIWTFDPVFGRFHQVTGVPNSLAPPSPTSGGTSSVLVRDRYGALLAGTASTRGNPVEIYLLQLNGLVVTQMTPYPLGTSTAANIAMIRQLTWMPNGNVAFAHWGVSNRLPGAGILNLATSNVTWYNAPVPTPFTSCCVAVDPNNGDLFLGFASINAISDRGFIYRVDLSTGTATLIANAPSAVTCMVCDERGHIIAATTTGVYEFDPALPFGTPPLVCNTVSMYGGLGRDDTTGELIMPLYDLARRTTTSILRSYCGGTRVAVPGFPIPTTPLAPSSFDVRKSLIEFVPPPTPNPFTWECAPNPGGAPRIGNATFSLTLTATPPPMAGFFVLGLGGSATPIPIPGLPIAHVLIDPAQPIDVRPVLAPTAVALPIPLGLTPFDLYAQLFHLNTGVWQGSSGLQIHVF